MSLIRDQIIAAISTALAPVGGNKFESLDAALASDATPALIYGWHSDEAEEIGMVDKHTLTVGLEVYTRGGTAKGDNSELLNDAYQKFMVDRSFGGLVKKLRIGKALRDSSRVGGLGVLLTQVIYLEYMTQRGSLTEKA